MWQIIPLFDKIYALFKGLRNMFSNDIFKLKIGKKSLCIFLPLIMLVLIYAIGYLKNKPNNTASKLTTVVIKPLTYTTIPLIITSYAEVTSPGSVTINAQASGIITSVEFSPGQQVKKGQLLFTLRSNSISEQLSQSKATLASAKEKYESYINILKQIKVVSSYIKYNIR